MARPAVMRRLRALIYTPLFLALLQTQLALASFDCKFSTGGNTYDLTPLHLATIERKEFTPPTTTVTSYTVSLCSSIPHDGTLSDVDQCPDGTRVCMVVKNQKEGTKEDRVISVVPIAGDLDGSQMETETVLGEKGQEREPPLNLTLKGGKYVSIPQSAHITLLCDPTSSEPSTPEFLSYDSSTGTLSLKWLTRHACPVSSTGEGGNGKEEEEGAGGEGERENEGGWGFFAWFFFLIFSGFIIYFVVGVYNNYNQYGATGWDLIPHRDFWRDVPYLVQDVCGHVVRSFTGRDGGGRGGYAALG